MKFFSALREWLLEDFVWKSFSVLLAIGIWLTVHRILVGGQAVSPPPNAATVNFTNVPVLFLSRTADVHDCHAQPAFISVTVSGNQEDIGGLQQNDVHASVDLSDVDAGNNTFRRVDISMPPGFSLVKVSPARVSVVIPPAHH